MFRALEGLTIYARKSSHPSVGQGNLAKNTWIRSKIVRKAYTIKNTSLSLLNSNLGSSVHGISFSYKKIVNSMHWVNVNLLG